MKAMPLKQAQARLYATAQRGQNAAVTVYTWKQDRWVEVTYKDDGRIILREHGYRNETSTFDQAHQLKRALKDACAREFPRSNKVHVSEHSKR
ncbi:hypothetical protein [Arcanobacterium hippocoleae]|uniref:DUF1508 domain-containing protein n=1 Tax=Arcanobacterium hippocoleae TaxID=149017 RepID=A0ABU1T1I3_9ACTO|nr:hypothetical protein [Arcanobacterium hippocoleae]MDR6938715.1 hypothetical protein [Arcanobacterium hippocoleae]